MYYGGDIAELLLALALVTTWRPQHPATRKPRQAKDPRFLPATSGRGEEIRGAEALEMASKQA
jgi:putative membrane protein